MRLRLLVVSLLIATALAGCLAGSGPEDAPGAPGDPTGDLNETVLKGGRATVSVDAGDWATLRISTEGWSDQQWALAVVADRSPGAVRYIGLATDHPAYPTNLEYFAWNGSAGNPVTLIRDCTGDCEPEEVILILGSEGGPSRFSLGVIEPEASQTRSPADPYRQIASRNATPVEPDFRGSGGWAGTLAFVQTDDRTISIDLGVGELSWGLSGPGDELITVEMTGRRSVDRGLAAFSIWGAWRTGGGGFWAADLTLPPRSEQGAAIEVSSGAITPRLYPAPVIPPKGTGLVATEPGTASFNLTRRTTSPGQVLLVNWGWSTADVRDLYDREWRNATVLPPADDGDDLGQSDLTMHVTVPGVGRRILGSTMPTWDS